MKAPEKITIAVELTQLDFALVAAAAAAEGVGMSEWASTMLPLAAANELQHALPEYIDELSERGVE